MIFVSQPILRKITCVNLYVEWLSAFRAIHIKHFMWRIVCFGVHQTVRSLDIPRPFGVLLYLKWYSSLHCCCRSGLKISAISPMKTVSTVGFPIFDNRLLGNIQKYRQQLFSSGSLCDKVNCEPIGKLWEVLSRNQIFPRTKLITS